MSSKEFFTLEVDFMGGDHGPSVTLPACRHFLDTHPNARLKLVGQANALALFQHERAVIVEAIAARDAEKAGKLMEAHVRGKPARAGVIGYQVKG